MTLKEVFDSFYYGEWLLFNYGDENVPEKIDRNGEDMWYYSFIINDDDVEDIEDYILQKLFEVDELPKFVGIYNADDDYLTLKTSAPFTPTEDEINEIYPYEDEE
jgi:hypothetical protein